MLAGHGIPLSGEIPFDPALRSVEEKHQTWASIDSESGIRIKAVLNAITSIITSVGLKNRKKDENHTEEESA
jgi:hypothetical protein